MSFTLALVVGIFATANSVQAHGSSCGSGGGRDGMVGMGGGHLGGWSGTGNHPTTGYVGSTHAGIAAHVRGSNHFGVVSLKASYARGTAFRYNAERAAVLHSYGAHRNFSWLPAFHLRVYPACGHTYFGNFRPWNYHPLNYVAYDPTASNYNTPPSSIVLTRRPL